MLLCPPLALGFSIVGIMRDGRRLYAAIMLLISAALTFWSLWVTGLWRALFP